MIITEAIKYNEFDLLTEFLFRYSKVSDAMHSKDKSVLVSEPAEELAAREILGLELMVQLVKLFIPNADGTRYFVTLVPSATMYCIYPQGMPHMALRPMMFCRGKWLF
jgi:hypothetical protein